MIMILKIRIPASTDPHSRDHHFPPMFAADLIGRLRNSIALKKEMAIATQRPLFRAARLIRLPLVSGALSLFTCIAPGGACASHFA